jgi:hypothetical protein
MKKSKKVCFVRLLTGDDLVGEVMKKTAKTVTLKNPMMIINNIEMLEGKQTLILYPWIPQGVSLGESVTIKMEIVVITTDVEPEIIEYYESICEMQFAEKPTVTSSTVTKSSEKGMNVVSFADAQKSKKDLN